MIENDLGVKIAEAISGDCHPMDDPVMFVSDYSASLKVDGWLKVSQIKRAYEAIVKHEMECKNE